VAERTLSGRPEQIFIHGFELGVVALCPEWERLSAPVGWNDGEFGRADSRNGSAYVRSYDVVIDFGSGTVI
jgi:hypothetical protein